MTIYEKIYLATSDARVGNFDTFYTIAEELVKQDENQGNEPEPFGLFIVNGGFYLIFDLALKKGDVKFLEFIDKLPGHFWTEYIDPRVTEYDFIASAVEGGSLDCLKFLKRAGFFREFNDRAVLTSMLNHNFKIFKWFIENGYIIHRETHYLLLNQTQSDLLDQIDWDLLFKDNEEWWEENIHRVSNRYMSGFVLRFELFKRGFSFSKKE